MDEKLKKALEEVVSMEAPSIPYLLNKYGYGYEARKVQELIDAYKESKVETAQ